MLGKVFDALDLTIPVMGQIERRQFRDGYFIFIGLRGLIGNGKQNGRHTGLGFPNAFHRGQLGGLVFQGVQAMQIAHENLYWNQDRGHRDTGAKRGHDVFGAVVFQPPIGADASQQKGRRQTRGQQHVRHAVREGGVEDHLEPTGHMGLPIDHLVTRWRVHPRIERQDPKGRRCGAQSHQPGGQGMHPFADPTTPEQHDAQEGGFQKESGEHFISEQGSRHIAHGVHETRPIGAKLKAHGDAADHAQGEGQGKNLDPELVGVHPVLLPSRYKPGFEKQQKPAHGDADGGKQNMESDVGSKLQTRQYNGVKGVHGLSHSVKELLSVLMAQVLKPNNL